MSGSLHAVFTLPRVVGVVCGFASPIAPVGLPNSITHGFYFFTNNGADIVGISESGRTPTAIWTRNTADSFEIRRVYDQVQYFVNGARIGFSNTRSSGPLVLSAALYMTGDQVG